MCLDELCVLFFGFVFVLGCLDLYEECVCVFRNFKFLFGLMMCDDIVDVFDVLKVCVCK